jgi:hypothetical protein
LGTFLASKQSGNVCDEIGSVLLAASRFSALPLRYLWVRVAIRGLFNEPLRENALGTKQKFKEVEELKSNRGRAEFDIDGERWREEGEILYFFSSMFP